MKDHWTLKDDQELERWFREAQAKPAEPCQTLGAPGMSELATAWRERDEALHDAKHYKSLTRFWLREGQQEAERANRLEAELAEAQKVARRLSWYCIVMGAAWIVAGLVWAVR